VKTSYRSKPTDEELLSAVSASDPEAAASAATVLGLRGDERAADALLALLRNQDPSARSAAASALGLLGSEAAIPALREACSDPDSTVALAASVALQRIGVEGCAEQACANLVSELASEDPERRALAARALGGMKECAALDPLVCCLEDPSAQVRADAAGSLGWMGDASVVPHLMSIGFTDPDQHVRKVAMHAVARLIVPETPL
jgi:HEAT repeat protein